MSALPGVQLHQHSRAWGTSLPCEHSQWEARPYLWLEDFFRGTGEEPAVSLFCSCCLGLSGGYRGDIKGKGSVPLL